MIGACTTGLILGEGARVHSGLGGAALELKDGVAGASIQVVADLGAAVSSDAVGVGITVIASVFKTQRIIRRRCIAKSDLNVGKVEDFAEETVLWSHICLFGKFNGHGAEDTRIVNVAQTPNRAQRG